MALSRVVFEIFNVEKYHDLQIPVKGQSRSLKVVAFDRLHSFQLAFYIVSLSLYDAPFLRYSISNTP